MDTFKQMATSIGHLKKHLLHIIGHPEVTLSPIFTKISESMLNMIVKGSVKVIY